MLRLFENRDCMEGMAEYPDKFFDLAIVDPMWDDNFNTDACADNIASKGNYKLRSIQDKKPDDRYFSELFRISTNQIIWGANWFNLFGRGGICWYKDNTGNYSPCEYAFQSFNNHIDFFQYRWNGMLQENMRNKEKRIHPTQKPVALYCWLLENYAKPGDKILDTHVGSASSLIAFEALGFEYVGFEIDKDYYEAAKKRLETWRSLPLFDEKKAEESNQLDLAI